MAVPKRKTPKAAQNQRRSHRALTARQLVACPNCRAMHVNHEPCKVCGTYHGRQALRQEEPAG
jgi:large subunit ribosomal protein L32